MGGGKQKRRGSADKGGHIDIDVGPAATDGDKD